MEESSAGEDGGGGIVTFGTFKGVFVPTLLTILGVIMYLRLGWVVGNVGLLGAWTVIALSFLITSATALSMSSLVSNVRIGPGGAYSIISRSLGLEMGGSVGLPLSLALAFSTAMYIFGFREGLQYVFPDLPALAVDLAIFAVVFAIVFLSTDIAFRLQYAILLVIVASLAAVFAAGIPAAADVVLVSAGEPAFWTVFAVFFPAATGIMAGANMSGELANPRKSIPAGTLGAIGVSFLVYLALAGWLAGAATPAELVGNFTILIEKAAYGNLVLAGLLAATFSSALNSLVGASRVLHAMGEHNILPASRWFSTRGTGGIPRNALLFTGLVVVASLMLRSLNTIAPLITMFFLITYAMINIVILVEQQLGLVSFRPLIGVPGVVPLVGTFGCVLVMFVIYPLFSLIAVVLMVGFYYILMYRHLEAILPQGDVRSSLFFAIAEWAAKKAVMLPHSQERAWKPHLLIPIEDPVEIRGISEFIRDIVSPRGSVTLLAMGGGAASARIETGLRVLSSEFQRDGIFVTWRIITPGGFAEGVIVSMQALKRAFFSPNVVFLQVPQDEAGEEDLSAVIRETQGSRMGVILLAPHPKAFLGRRTTINLWLSDQCAGWTPGMPYLDCDLAMLIAYQLRKNWQGDIRVVIPLGPGGEEAPDKERITHLFEEARIHVEEILVVHRTREDFLCDAPLADISIFTCGPDPDFASFRQIVTLTGTTCLFCRDSSEENVLA